MNKAPTPPQTPGHWLATSICWTLGGVGSWLALNAAVLDKPYAEKTPSAPLFFLGFAVLHGLLWWRAAPGLVTDRETNSWVGLLAFVWLVGLIVFQFISLAVMLLAFASAFFCEPVNWE